MNKSILSKAVLDRLLGTAAINEASTGKFSMTRMGFMFCTFLDGREEDTACAAFFSGRMKYLGISVTDISCIHLCDLIDRNAAYFGAGYFAVAHTHAGNPVVPSNEDLNTTEILKRRYSGSPLVFLDHYIVSDYDYMSVLTANRRTYRIK